MFDPNQFRTIPESRFVLRARLPVVPSVFLKNVPVLPQRYISPPDDRRWSIIHTMHPYGRTLFLGQSLPAFNGHVRFLPELQRLVDINIIFAEFPRIFRVETA
jgi:hypothetical protein